MFRKSPKLLSLLTAAALLCGCSAFDNSSSDSSKDSGDASSEAVTTTKATVTLPADSSSEAEEESSSDDESSSAPDSSDESSTPNEEKQDSCTPLMWKVTADDGHEIIFMGSMHALKPEIYPLPERIMTAYENAEVLAVECDITSITGNFASQIAMLREMTYSDPDETVEDHLSKETVEGLKSFLAQNGYSFEFVANYKPWAIESIAEEIITIKADLNASSGIDANLLTMAHDDNKEIYEVESAQFQMDMLMNFSDEIMDITLSGYSAENEDTLVEQMNDLYNVWKNGDLEEVEALLLAEDEESYGELTEEQTALLDEYNKQMLYDRNIGMADAAEKLLKEHEHTFFVVGLAHFMGDGGIVDLLTQRGYTVEQI